MYLIFSERDHTFHTHCKAQSCYFLLACSLATQVFSHIKGLHKFVRSYFQTRKALLNTVFFNVSRNSALAAMRYFKENDEREKITCLQHKK